MNIHIPPAALEAGSEAVANAKFFGRTAEEIARAAFVAMVEAWEGAMFGNFPEHDKVRVELILPLMETRDE